MTAKELFVALQEMAQKAKIDDKLNIVVQVELTGADSARWTAAASNGTLSISEDFSGTADINIKSSTETAIGIFQKKIKPLMALLTGKVKISGDTTKIAMLKSLLSGKK